MCGCDCVDERGIYVYGVLAELEIQNSCQK